MARIPRVVVPGVPHHVTQRGARRMQVFFDASDFDLYRDLLGEQADRLGVAIWAYCLMPNHVHLVAVPTEATSLARALSEAHRRYAFLLNKRHGWRGHLWQERFWSFPLDEGHLRSAARYVLLNPVRAGLVDHAADWPHSSARASLFGRADPLVDAKELEARLGEIGLLLEERDGEGDAEIVRRHSATGRPLGDEEFVASLEERLGRPLRKGKPGRKTA